MGGHVTNSPLRDNMLHSLNNATPTVPDGISYDLDKTLATISLEIPPISSESSFYTFNETNINVKHLPNHLKLLMTSMIMSLWTLQHMLYHLRSTLPKWFSEPVEKMSTT